MFFWLQILYGSSTYMIYVYIWLSSLFNLDENDLRFLQLFVSLFIWNTIFSLKLEHSLIYKVVKTDDDIVVTLWQYKNGTALFGVNQSESYF